MKNGADKDLDDDMVKVGMCPKCGTTNPQCEPLKFYLFENTKGHKYKEAGILFECYRCETLYCDEYDIAFARTKIVTK